MYNGNRRKEEILLKEPKEGEDYEYHVDHKLVICCNDNEVEEYVDKSFHANKYCLDSKPEKKLLCKYIMSNKVKEVFFIGMFTSEQNELYIQYADPDTHRIRKYYLGFLVKLDDDTYQINEVKLDNMIGDKVIQAK